MKQNGVLFLCVLFLFAFLMIVVFGSDVSYADANGAITTVVNGFGNVGKDWVGSLGKFLKGETTAVDLTFGWVGDLLEWILDELARAITGD